MLIQEKISFRFKYRFLLFLQKFKPYKYFKDFERDINKSYAFVFLAADYGNLGDVAITYAQTQFLRESLDQSYEIMEIPISKSLEGLQLVKKYIKAGDIVTTVGGGNLGNMYDQIEYIRQLVVYFFPRNKFISFPQTFDFDSTRVGKKALEQAQNVYNHHPDIYFIAREQTSFKLMSEHFNKVNVLLTPDIVISLDKVEPIKNRHGAIICMRNDKEKNISESQLNFIKSQAQTRFESLNFYDTHIGRNNLNIMERELELNKIWDAFRSAELVITDRLHGMIFCHITNTPCLVFQNSNHKVKETYEWIKGNPNIHLMSQFDKEKIDTFFRSNFSNIGSFQVRKEVYNPIKEILN